MTNHAAKLLFGFAAFGAAAALGYQWVIGDRAGSLLFLGVATVAALAGLATQGAVGRDWAPRVDPDAPPESRPVDALDVARPSAWPLVTALAVGASAVGAAFGPAWLLAGLSVAAVPALGWLVQVWREHPAWTPRLGDRLAQRAIAPLITPVGTAVLAIFIAFSMSRTLLAVSETASWVIGLVIASALLALLALIASRPRVSSTAVLGLTAVGAVVTVGLGIVGASAGEREFHPHEDGVPTQKIVANQLAFDKKKLTLPAGTLGRIEFRNLDVGVYHNVAVYEKKDGAALWNGKPIPEGEFDYEIETPKEPGTYYFVCDFHPTMEGDLEVTASTGADGHGEGESDEEHDE